MHNYTEIILSFLLLLGNTASSKDLIIANELELSATFFTGTSMNDHGTKKPNSSPEKRSKIRNYSQFINIIPASGLDNQCIVSSFGGRGSGR